MAHRCAFTRGQQVADEKDPKHARVGPFRLGKKFDEVGPELGLGV